MLKRAMLASAAFLSFGVPLAPGAFAQVGGQFCAYPGGPTTDFFRAASPAVPHRGCPRDSAARDSPKG